MVIGLDPGNATGWAFRDSAGAWQNGTLAPENFAAVDHVLVSARAAGVTVAAIESPFLGKNVQTLRVLSEIRGRLISACERQGLTIRNVAPLQWKSAMIMTPAGMPQGREAQKRAAIAKAKALGASVNGDDQADAVCLCEYANFAGQQENFDLQPGRKPNLGKCTERKRLP